MLPPPCFTVKISLIENVILSSTEQVALRIQQPCCVCKKCLTSVCLYCVSIIMIQTQISSGFMFNQCKKFQKIHNFFLTAICECVHGQILNAAHVNYGSLKQQNCIKTHRTYKQTHPLQAAPAQTAGEMTDVCTHTHTHTHLLLKTTKEGILIGQMGSFFCVHALSNISITTEHHSCESSSVSSQKIHALPKFILALWFIHKHESMQR